MLTFIEFTGSNTADGHRLARYACDCGNVQTFAASRVRHGYANMCKACKIEVSRKSATKHGMRGTREYRIWSGIKTRCYNKNSKDYAKYGQSGITMFNDWKNSFQSFFNYMGECPSPDHSIDRIDNDQGYQPGNVRWASKLEQARNKKNATYVTDGKRVYRINEVANMLGISRGAAHLRLKRGKLDGFTAHTTMDE